VFVEDLRRIGRRRGFWIGVAAVLAPLALLLGMQYRWLGRLEEADTILRRATLNNFLEAVATEHEFFYRSRGEQLLNVPPELFSEGRLSKMAGMWHGQDLDGLRTLFLVDYTRSEFGNFLVYDFEKGGLYTPPSSDESLAIILACAPWQMRSERRTVIGAGPLRVDEGDPSHRIVLRTVTDEGHRVMGIAGFLVDEKFLHAQLLPAVLDKSFFAFFEEKGGSGFAIALTNGEGETLLGDPGAAKAAAARRNLPFVFTDWTLHLQHFGDAEPDLARSNFALNLSFSLLLALLLIGGLLFSLRAARRAVMLSELKSDFVSNVSHELRTPLASIRVYAELLSSGRARNEEQVCQYGGTIEAESRRLSRMIENVLDLSRIESGRKSYRFETVDLAVVVEETLTAFRLRPGVRGFLVEYSGPDVPLPELQADGEALGRVLGNLLDNALKYSGDSRYIGVTLRRRGDSILLSVTDRGVGIPREELGAIFDRFHRVGRSLVHEVKGSGLGLAIVKHVTMAHGGTVAVESELGRGSIFTLRLPIRNEEATS